ncbi:MAG TPA: adenosylcobinamide-phosphate synthase CbiB [Syntrophobacteraceae bacterium]|nr:adenosylcobinamide-phosphate synthase CbiB [Syntrophobacteraceae bacterium]
MVFLPWHLLSAYLLDLAAGDPPWLPHPVRWIGRLVARTEKVLYPESASPLLMRVSGLALWAVVIAIVLCATKVFIAISGSAGRTVGSLALIWLAYSTLATRSLHMESSRVAQALRAGDLHLARIRLSFIVSRETSQLDRDAVLRALVETVSENISDAIVAPLFYMGLFGPVGALVYKAINTMDSMLGYKNERYRYFGSFAARTDDIANWLPARISGWLLVGASACMGGDWRAASNIMRRDARKMKSPNAGYPEAAAAGALGVQLGGTSCYFGQPVEKPLLGDPINRITLETYTRMIRLMYLSSGLAFVMAACMVAIRHIFGGLGR